MPIYEFQCPQCGLQFEVSRGRDNAGQPAFCPQDGTQAQRVWAAVSYFWGRDKSLPEIPPLPPAHGPGEHSHGPGGHTHGPGTHTH